MAAHIMVKVSIGKVIAAAIAGLSLAGCGLDFSGTVGSGNVTTQTRNIGGTVDAVWAGSGLDVVVEQGDVLSVSIEADDNLHEHIIIKTEGNTLVVSADWRGVRAKSKKVIVRTPSISALESHSGSHLAAAGVLKGEQLRLLASSGGHMSATVEAGKVLAESSSGSRLSVSGKAARFDGASSTGADIDAGKLVAEDVSAQASTGGRMMVHPMQKLDAKASTGGFVFYTNIPQSLAKAQATGGRILKRS